jgi:hypothetical protein
MWVAPRVRRPSCAFRAVLGGREGSDVYIPLMPWAAAHWGASGRGPSPRQARVRHSSRRRQAQHRPRFSVSLTQKPPWRLLLVGRRRFTRGSAPRRPKRRRARRRRRRAVADQCDGRAAGTVSPSARSSRPSRDFRASAPIAQPTTCGTAKVRRAAPTATRSGTSGSRAAGSACAWRAARAARGCGSRLQKIRRTTWSSSAAPTKIFARRATRPSCPSPPTLQSLRTSCAITTSRSRRRSTSSRRRPRRRPRHRRRRRLPRLWCRSPSPSRPPSGRHPRRRSRPRLPHRRRHSSRTTTSGSSWASRCGPRSRTASRGRSTMARWRCRAGQARRTSPRSRASSPRCHTSRPRRRRRERVH